MTVRKRVASGGSLQGSLCEMMPASGMIAQMNCEDRVNKEIADSQADVQQTAGTGAVAPVLAAAVQPLTALQDAGANKCDIAGDDTEQIALALAKLPILTHLRLSNNPLGASGATALSLVLAGRRVPLRLQLHECELDGAADSALAAGAAESFAVVSVCPAQNDLARASTQPSLQTPAGSWATEEGTPSVPPSLRCIGQSSAACCALATRGA